MIAEGETPDQSEGDSGAQVDNKFGQPTPEHVVQSEQPQALLVESF